MCRTGVVSVYNNRVANFPGEDGDPLLSVPSSSPPISWPARRNSPRKRERSLVIIHKTQKWPKSSRTSGTLWYLSTNSVVEARFTRVFTQIPECHLSMPEATAWKLRLSNAPSKSPSAVCQKHPSNPSIEVSLPFQTTHWILWQLQQSAFLLLPTGKTFTHT